MQARWVVEAVDVAGDGGVRVGLGVIHAGDFLVLERGKVKYRFLASGLRGQVQSLALIESRHPHPPTCEKFPPIELIHRMPELRNDSPADLSGSRNTPNHD